MLCPARTRGGRPEQPAADTPAEANIGPSGEITALAVGFGHLVPEDTIRVNRRVETTRGGLTYEFPVAGLASWLCLRSDPLMRRDKPKDAYDIIWVLDALGPEQAANLVLASPLLHGPYAAEVLAQLALLTDDQFRDETSVGPVAYAAFVPANPTSSTSRHAHGTVAAYRQALTSRDFAP